MTRIKCLVPDCKETVGDIAPPICRTHWLLIPNRLKPRLVQQTNTENIRRNIKEALRAIRLIEQHKANDKYPFFP